MPMPSRDAASSPEFGTSGTEKAEHTEPGVATGRRYWTCASVRFVGDLPGKPATAQKREPRYDALVERLGEWAEWWGDHPYYVHKCVRTVRRVTA